MPTGSAVVVESRGARADRLRAPEIGRPAQNCTVPVMVPAVPEVTVAFSVTEVPDSCGLSGETVSTVVVEFRGFTVYKTGCWSRWRSSRLPSA